MAGPESPVRHHARCLCRLAGHSVWAMGHHTHLRKTRHSCCLTGRSAGQMKAACTAEESPYALARQQMLGVNQLWKLLH